MLVRNVSDTARWVAMYRAMESDRPDASFAIHSLAAWLVSAAHRDARA
jgi:hypothetical protein